MTKKKVSKKEEPKKLEPEFQLLGWKCPVCGRGNSPWSSICPCLPVVNVYPTWPPYDPGRPMFPTNPQYDPNLPYYKVTCEAKADSLRERLKRAQSFERLNERGGFGWKEVKDMAKLLKEREAE